MRWYLSVRVFDTSGKDLLQASELVDVQLDSSFHDVLADLPGDVASRELKSVQLREFESAPDAHSTNLTGKGIVVCRQPPLQKKHS